AMAEASGHFKDVTPEQLKQLRENFGETLDAFRESKAAAADYASTVAVTALAIGSTIVTGGTSMPLIIAMAAAGAAIKVSAKAAFMGSDYDTTDSAAVGKDLVSGAIEGFTNVIGPGEVAGLFKVGETAALKAAEDTVIQLGEQALTDLGEKELETLGVKTAAEYTEKVLGKEGEKALEEGTKELMEKTLAHGAEEIDKKAIQELSEKAVSKELVGEVRKQAVKQLSETLEKNLTERLKEETANW